LFIDATDLSYVWRYFVYVTRSFVHPTRHTCFLLPPVSSPLTLRPSEHSLRRRCNTIITSLATAVAKYCYENVCVAVCVCLSVCPRAYLPNHTRDLYQFFAHVAYRRGSVLLQQGDAIPRWRGNFGVFFPIENAMYSIAFKTHTKTAEPIEMPFGFMTRVGRRYHVLDGNPIPKGKGQLVGVVRALKSIDNLRCRRRCRCRLCCYRDHSIANNVMQQTGSFSMPGDHK